MAEFNLIDGIQLEINRCQELLKIYEGIPAGAFGGSMIKQAILSAEKAMSGGDVVEMVKCYRELEGCE
jgi:hypothetical protein